MITIKKENLLWLEFRCALVHSLLSKKEIEIHGIDKVDSKYNPLIEDIKNITINYFQCQWLLKNDILHFIPGKVNSGKYNLASGDYSSAIEILLFLMPILFEQNHSSVVTIEGVTHCSFGRSSGFIKEGILPMLEKWGLYASCKLERFGFYGTGKGKVVSHIYPSECKEDKTEEKKLEIFGCRIFISGLSTALAERQKKLLSSTLNIDESTITIMEIVNAAGMGNSLIVYTNNGVFCCDIDAYNEVGDLIYNEDDAKLNIESMVKEIKDVKVNSYISKDILHEVEIFNGIELDSQGISGKMKSLFK